MSLVQYIKELQTSGATSQEYKNAKTKNHLLAEVSDEARMMLLGHDEIRSLSIIAAKQVVLDTAMDCIEKIIDTKFSSQAFDALDKAAIYEMLVQSMFGFGVLESLLKDEQVTEIMVNRYDRIFTEKNGGIERAVDKNGDPLAFSSNDELKSIIQKIVAPINRKVDESDPIVDARLPDGSRVNVALPPISLDGISMTIRKFPESPYTMDELIQSESLSAEAGDFLQNAVTSRCNIIVSGGTGSGKTTLLNALSGFIPEMERIITVEDSAELKFKQIQNIVRLETRLPNIEGRGEITMRTLVRSALRMRPDRIIVGEVRGGEALDMLQAMNTGHDGSLSTGHANSPIDMLLRLETMVMMAGYPLPLSAIRQQITSAIDIIVHLGKNANGRRVIMEISEILGLDHGEYEINPLFKRVNTSDCSVLKKTNFIPQRSKIAIKDQTAGNDMHR